MSATIQRCAAARQRRPGRSDGCPMRETPTSPPGSQHARTSALRHDTDMTQPADRLREQFGEIDVYLFDQLLRGRIAEGMRVLDAGCGAGRNLVFLMRQGFDVWGVDENPEMVVRVRQLAASIAPRLESDRFRVEPVEAMSL